MTTTLYIHHTTTMSAAQEPTAQITNTLFPPPPEFFKQFTDENLARYEELTSNEAGPSKSPRAATGPRTELDAEEREELERLRASLAPPRSDWIEEEGRWVTFGEMSTVGDLCFDGITRNWSWYGRLRSLRSTSSPLSSITLPCSSRAKAQTRPHIPTAAEIGLRPLIDPNEPPQTSLKPLLHSFLHTLLLLIDVLTGSARPPHELAEKGWGHEGDQVCYPKTHLLIIQYIQHMSNLAATIMVTANTHREAQAEATLVLLMEKQVETRRAQTEALRR